MTLVRINKFLSDRGICSRRKADEHILAGDVTVNSRVVKQLGVKIDPDKDEVKFQNKIVKEKTSGYIYYALNKPRGVISTASDESGRKTVLDLVPKSPRVYPVGRLDKDSEGLIILTNDGDFANDLMHPSGGHEKEYEVKIKGQNLNTEDIKSRLLRGLRMDGQLMQISKVEIEQMNVNRYIMRAVLNTGYNRQIRKMCAKINLEISYLKRVRIADLKLSELKLEPGKYILVKKTDIVAKK